MNRLSAKIVALVVLLAYGSMISQVTAESLKTVPSTQDLLDLLTDPLALPAHNPLAALPGGTPNTCGNPLLPGGVTSPGGFPCTLPPLAVFPLDINPLTGVPMRVIPLAPSPDELAVIPPGTIPNAIDFFNPTLPNAVFPLAPTSVSPLLPGPLVAPSLPLTPYRTLLKPLNEGDFIVNKTAAIQLGKALFWDMQVGSDGVQACGTCHFHAGADNRVKNQLSPGFNSVPPDFTLSLKGVTANQTVNPGDFPIRKLATPNNASQASPGGPPVSAIVRDSNDVMSSMGVRFRKFLNIPAPGPGAFIAGTNPPVLAPDLSVGGAADNDPITVFAGLRRVEPRNTPTFFGVTNNFNNFWDGRARHDFNGKNPFGASDPRSNVYVDNAGLTATRQLVVLSSIASLATGPALSPFEMSFNGRFWAKLGRKLLQNNGQAVTPLANQLVSTTDSALGPLSNQLTVGVGVRGLNVSYATLIEQAFDIKYWGNTTSLLAVNAGAADDPVIGVTGVKTELIPFGGAADLASTDQFTQKEANFSLFFGLAVQAYAQTLVPNDSPFDRFLEANPGEPVGILTNPTVGLTPRQLLGYDLFQGSNLGGQNPNNRLAKCILCHVEPTLSTHAVDIIQGTMFPAAINGGKLATVTGFFLEDTMLNPASAAVELDAVNSTMTPVPVPTGIALIDEGIYNIGVRPTNDDLGRGGNDPFSQPLSLAALALRNHGLTVNAAGPPPGASVLPGTLAPFVNPLPLGGVVFPPGFTVSNANADLFTPNVVAPDPNVVLAPSGTNPFANRVARNGAFKVPQLRNVELTGPYFHNGGQLTLRQVVDFYGRAGDFPITNAADRDVLILPLNTLADLLLADADKTALVDFLLALTDERVKFERAPFDHPEIIVPLDGTAPDNTAGRTALVATGLFRTVNASGAAGILTPLTNFLGVSSNQAGPAPTHFDAVTLAQTPTTTFTGAPASAQIGSTFTVASTTNSTSLPVYTSSGACTNVGTLYTITASSGTCTSTVTWAGDSTFAGATRNQTTTALPILATVTLTVPDNTASRTSLLDTGQFKITRTGATTSALTVNFTKNGTAKEGIDYSAIGSSVTIPIGASFKTINIVGKKNAMVPLGQTRTVIVTVSPNPTGYIVGTPNTGTVNIK